MGITVERSKEEKIQGKQEGKKIKILLLKNVLYSVVIGYGIVTNIISYIVILEAKNYLCYTKY